MNSKTMCLLSAVLLLCACSSAKHSISGSVTQATQTGSMADCGSSPPPAAATDHDTFSDADLSFSLPFNPDWKVSPFEVVDDSVQFGPKRRQLASVQAGCTNVRDFIYRVTGKRSASDAQNDDKEQFPVAASDVTVQVFGDVSAVVMSNVRGACPAPVVEVIGKAHNYVFTTSCAAMGANPNILGDLIDIMKTVKLK